MVSPAPGYASNKILVGAQLKPDEVLEAAGTVLIVAVTAVLVSEVHPVLVFLACA